MSRPPPTRTRVHTARVFVTQQLADVYTHSHTHTVVAYELVGCKSLSFFVDIIFHVFLVRLRSPGASRTGRALSGASGGGKNLGLTLPGASERLRRAARGDASRINPRGCGYHTAGGPKRKAAANGRSRRGRRLKVERSDGPSR